MTAIKLTIHIAIIFLVCLTFAACDTHITQSDPFISISMVEGRVAVIYDDLSVCYYPTISDLIHNKSENVLRYPAEIGHLMLGSLHFEFGIQDQPLPFGVWPASRSPVDYNYLGGTAYGPASLFVWLELKSNEIYADLTICGANQVLNLSNYFQQPVLETFFLQNKERLYWNFLGDGNDTDKDDVMVFFCDGRFLIYNYPRDLLLEITWILSPSPSAIVEGGMTTWIWKIQLEQQLELDGNSIDKYYEIACSSICCSTDSIFVALREKKGRGDLVKVIEASIPDASSSVFIAKTIAIFHGVPVNNDGTMKASLAVDENTVLLATGNKFYWCSRK